VVLRVWRWPDYWVREKQWIHHRWRRFESWDN
jgi:hypothetical protein